MARGGVVLRLLATGWAGLFVQGCFIASKPPSPPPFVSVPGTSVTGTASWYGPGFNGHRTSSGAIYNQEDLSAASTLFPLGTWLMVTNLANGRTVKVVVNDHGPYVKGRDLDLSHRAALVLGIIKPGTARVRMHVLSTPAGGPVLGPRYFVQVGSFSDPQKAQRLRRRLGRYYHDVEVIEAASNASRHYRVRMGMFTDRASAEARALTVTHIGLHPLIISE